MPPSQAPSDADVRARIRIDENPVRLARRLEAGEIAVIDRPDLDRATARLLIDAQPTAILNASASSTGRYPNLGPALVLKAGILLLDDLGSDIMTLREGDTITISGTEVTQDDRLIASGHVMTDEDDLADKYLIAEKALTEAGYVNYEVSNWARSRDGHDHRCRHNMAYWLGRDWWGIGPGAHSHVNGTRWWNVKHPATYRGRLAEGRLPVEDHEVLDAEQRHEETVLLQLRLADGLPLSQLTEVERHRADHVVEQGLGAIRGGHLVLNLSGRMVADRIITDLLV